MVFHGFPMVFPSVGRPHPVIVSGTEGLGDSIRQAPNLVVLVQGVQDAGIQTLVTWTKTWTKTWKNAWSNLSYTYVYHIYIYINCTL